MKRELIDRAAALDGVAAWDWQELYLPAHFKQVIEDCPTVEERRRGRWEITEAWPHNVYCSECHKRFAQTHWAIWEDGSLPRNFCPECGAEMENSEKEPAED